MAPGVPWKALREPWRAVRWAPGGLLESSWGLLGGAQFTVTLVCRGSLGAPRRLLGGSWGAPRALLAGS
eukprot:538904-Pyramimonas_sp.AAC.1